MSKPLQLLSADALFERLVRIRTLMGEGGMHSMLVSSNVNKLYLTGRVFAGFVFVTADPDSIVYFMKEGDDLGGENVRRIHKPENISEIIVREHLAAPGPLGLELDEASSSYAERLRKAMGADTVMNASPLLLRARSVKAPDEIRAIEECGVKQDHVYRTIPHLYRGDGMTDIELQIEIERMSRLTGSLGILRCTGHDMEINMGSVLTGDNADTPSPYDFAMGGEGASPALPVGANGSVIRPHTTVMVDTNGAFNAYMTDMTRVFSLDEIPAEAVKAHRLSIDICRRLEELGKPGVKASDLYDEAFRMATEAGLADCFMGHREHAGFVGHGIGLTINELPVLSPRSKNVLEENNVIAVEPKFVIPHVGAVGIENTYQVTPGGLRRLTNAPEDIISL